MASLAFYLAASVLLAPSTVAFNCSRAPIYVDIHKRAVHDSPEFQYGSFVGVGSPAQNHSLWPSLAQNHTSFAAPTFCGTNSTLRECDTSTGGFFSSKDSTTFQESKDFKSLDNGDNTTLDGYFGEDTLRLYTHYFETDGASQTLLENSTVLVAEEGSSVPGVVGMGLSSTVLRDLAARDMIAGKTYSLYIGQGFARAGGAVNGSNVFGGYDSGRFTGPVHKYPMNTAREHPMTVKIKDIFITSTQDPNSNVSLFDTQKFPAMKSRPSTFEAEITTSQFPLSLPYQLTQNFIAHLNAAQDNTWGDNSLKLKDDFSGTLSIVLEDGFTVTFPPEVLRNASNITPIQDRSEDSDLPFYLGSAFLGQTYLMADFEAQSFFLAEAIQKNNAVMPVSFCPKGPDPVAYERPKQGAWVKQGLIGAVLGGVLGGMGIAVCVYCFVLSCQRRVAERKVEKAIQADKRAKYAQMDIEEVPEFDPPPKSATPFFWNKR